MADVMWWTGTIVSFAAAVLALAAACVGSIRLVVYEIDKLREQGRDGWLDWQKQKLRSASWWFSEDEPTRELLADLAELSEWEARDKWRKRRLAASGAADSGTLSAPTDRQE